MKSTIKQSTIAKILDAAKNSPSSHNTQPWHVVVDGPVLYIGYENARHLKIGDPDKRELIMSLGCFIETIILAAKSMGYDARCSYLLKLPEKVAKITIQKSKKTSEDWIKYIVSRRSDRRYYTSEQIPENDIKTLGSLKIGDAHLSIFKTKPEITLLSASTRSATRSIMLDANFREELASWVRNNWTKKHDGMPGYTQGMPGPISLIAKFVIKKTKKVANDQAKKDSKRIAHSSAVGLICIDKTKDMKSWLDAGRLYQLVCLETTKMNIKTSAISAAVIYPPTVKSIRSELRLGSTPVALLRMGYKKGSVKHAPRRPIAKFVSNL